MEEDKKETLSKLYSIRAGISAVAEQRKKAEEIIHNANAEITELENEITNLNYENEKLPKEKESCQIHIDYFKKDIDKHSVKKGDKIELRFGYTSKESTGYNIYKNMYMIEPETAIKDKIKSNHVKEAFLWLIAPLIAAIYIFIYIFFNLYEYDTYGITGIILGIVGGILGIIGIFGIYKLIDKLTNLRNNFDWHEDNFNKTVDECKRIKSVIANAIIKNENRIKEIEQQIPKNKKRIEEIQLKISQLKADTDIACTPYHQLGSMIQEQFEKQFGQFLNLRDWKNTDVFIFAYESGRVDNMKEAFTYVDGEVRTDRIVKAINDSAQMVCRSIQSGLHSLALSMGECFKVISGQIAEQTNYLNKINANLENISSDVQSLAANTASASSELSSLAAKVDFSNALQQQRNESTAKMAQENEMFLLQAKNYMSALDTQRSINGGYV